MSTTTFIWTCIFSGTVLGVHWFFQRFERATPNQWLILLRKGQPIREGIGIVCWRRPQDSVARFTSTMQRVTFDTQVHTQDKQIVHVEGFMLWSIASTPGSPFKAFSKLGIAHQELDNAHPDVQESTEHNPHHALNRAQHQAFRRNIEAVLRTAAVAFPFREVLSSPATLLEHVQAQVTQTLEEWGLHLERIEFNNVQVVQQELFEHLQAPYLEKSREEAEHIQLTSKTQRHAFRLEQEVQQAQQEAETLRQKELAHSRTELKKEDELSKLWEEQLKLKHIKLEQEQAWNTTQIEAQHAQSLEQLQYAFELQKQEELQQSEIAHLQELRNEQIVQAQLKRRQLEYEVELAHKTSLLQLEEQKSESMRSAELSQTLIASAAHALEQLPIRDIRWFSQNEQGPSSVLLGLVETLQELATPLYSSNVQEKQTSTKE